MVEQNEHTPAKRKVQWLKTLPKRWVLPISTMAAGALVIALMWAYQQSTPVAPSSQQPVGMVVTEHRPTPTVATTTPPFAEKQPAVAVSAPVETMGWPVAQRETMRVSKTYFQQDRSTRADVAVIEYGDTFKPHIGIDVVQPAGRAFEVVAAMGGKVTRATDAPLIGQVIEIDHGNGLKSVYQSVTDRKVVVGDTVAKGQVIAMAGRNELEKEQGIHVHFEVWHENKPVDPQQWVK